MPKYKNGYIPASELVTIEGNHPATRGTAARWAALKADVLKNEGVTLRITGGENAYRSYAGQVFARNAACRAGRCNDAAVPGTSSHGGSLNGRDSGAIDVNNWAVLGKEKFYAYCRRNGFEPGYFDWEPWHIIDWDPYNVPTAAGGGGGEIMIDKETFIAWVQEWAKYRSRDGGGADYKGGPTIFERINSALDSLGKLIKSTNPDEFSGGTGWPWFRNAMSRWLTFHSRADGHDGKGPTLHEHLDQLEKAIRESKGDMVTVKLDAAMLAAALADPKVVAAFAGPIAKAVNDDHYNRMKS